MSVKRKSKVKGPIAFVSRARCPQFLHSAIDGYLRYFAAGHSNTSRAKKLDLDRFLEFVRVHRGYSKAEKVPLKDFTRSSTSRFVDECLRQGEAPATVARRLATVKHFGNLLASQYEHFENPAVSVRPPQVKRHAPSKITKDERRKIEHIAELRIGEKDSFIRKRNVLLFEFLVTTGLRVEEVRTLTMAQLSPNLDSINRIATTGRKFRSVILPKTIRTRLRMYMDARHKELLRYYRKLSKRQDLLLPIFISGYGAQVEEPDSFRMGAKSVWRSINELSANIKLHPHLLRHAYAMEILNETGDIKAVANALGHSDLRLTHRYREPTSEKISKK